jgi:processive 1,2-diacylglycerol beta-glucosyltransferase
MKKVLFMPFLQIPSGHHQVADTLIDGIKEIQPNIECEKVDILKYGYGFVEKFVSEIYIKWISHLPKIYSWIYKKSVCEDMEDSKRYRHYELLFLHVMREIVKEKSPDLIVCTHALPSYMLSQLKQKGVLQVPVVNVYTDFFINHLWGIEGIDLHFAPSKIMKEYLLRRGVEESRIYVTGIPVHPKLSANSTFVPHGDTLRFLVTGGNLGVGALDKLVEKMQEQQSQYYVLCGTNEKLYEHLCKINKPNIIPVPYIKSREEMDHLYSICDGIITKPGGVTISESLSKRIPIFVYHTLPGQEEMNLEQLRKLEVAKVLTTWEKKDTFEEDLISFFLDNEALQKYLNKVEEYHINKDPVNPAKVILQLS